MAGFTPESWNRNSYQMTNKELLIVCNTPSKNTLKLRDRFDFGAKQINSVNVSTLAPLNVTVEHIIKTDAIIIGTTENLGYMSGLIKDMFDRIYYPCLEKKQGMPVLSYIRAKHDGTGTKMALETIIVGLKWRWVKPIRIFKGEWQDDWLLEAEQEGTWVAAALDMGLI